MVTLGRGTHVGLRRSRNEDGYVAREDMGLWLVADGMGGPGGGDVASDIAVRHIVEGIERGLTLQQATSQAHEAILDAAQQGKGRPGMGSTIVAVQASGDCFELLWVGDSRAYLWDGMLTRLTRDHSVVQELVDTGMLSEAQARASPHRNVITQALGAEGHGPLVADTLRGSLEGGQQILLCTDGLTSEVDDTTIATVLNDSASSQAAVDTLIAAALEGGGSDNVTALLIGLDPGVQPGD